MINAGWVDKVFHSPLSRQPLILQSAMDFFVVTLSRMMKNFLAKSNDEKSSVYSYFFRLSQSLENASENINLLDFMAIDCCFLMNFLSRLLPKHQRQLKLLKVHNFTNFARIVFQLHLDATTKILWIFYMTLFLLASFMLFSFPGALLFRVTCTNFSFCMLEEK